jgi:uracil-DNA glycosylase
VRVSALVQIKRHVTRLKGCTDCADMIGPVVTGTPVVSPVMLIGQAPGDKEGPAGKPFAWTAGKTMFQWFSSIGLAEEAFRARVYMAAVCRCFPGKAEKGGDRVPSPVEIERCSRHIATEVKILQPQLVIPVGKLAIAQLLGPSAAKDLQLKDIVGVQQRITLAGHAVEMIPLPHPSGASTWHRTEPGKTLLGKGLALIAKHPAWQSLVHESEYAHASP